MYHTDHNTPGIATYRNQPVDEHEDRKRDKCEQPCGAPGCAALDLYQLIAEVLSEHSVDPVQASGGGYKLGDDDAKAIALTVGDLLIDLAGTGQLLTSMDRIARGRHREMNDDV